MCARSVPAQRHDPELKPGATIRIVDFAAMTRTTSQQRRLAAPDGVNLAAGVDPRLARVQSVVCLTAGAPALLP